MLARHISPACLDTDASGEVKTNMAMRPMKITNDTIYAWRGTMGEHLTDEPAGEAKSYMAMRLKSQDDHYH